MKSRLYFAAAIAAVVLSFQACKNKDKEPADNSGDNTEEVKDDKKDESEGGTVTVKDGAILAEFSVESGSSARKVRFSQGNLQYKASTGTWRFAEHQYDYVGDANKNISETYDGWIDLFGWGTSGWKSGAVAYQPWSVSTTNEDYYPGEAYDNDLNGAYAKADWGIYNTIENGGAKGTWRTLTKDEWLALLSKRAAALRSLATVCGVQGLIILPDNWEKPASITYAATTENYTTNTYSASQWTLMESYGAVFLPAAGYRSGASVRYAGSDGSYWSSSYRLSDYAYSLHFSSSTFYPASNYGRLSGLAVRLVQDVE